MREAARMLAKLEAQATAEKDAAEAESAASSAAAEPPEPEDELDKGEVVYYNHREAGWILVKVVGIDREGATEAGGCTYCIGGAPQLKGAEIETTRRRLFRTLTE